MDIGTDLSRDELQSTKPITVTIATARKLSGLGNTTVWALLKRGKLEAVRVGRRTLITVRSLEALLAPASASEPQPSRRDRPRKAS
jgi:excisionase family DNA binding protein